MVTPLKKMSPSVSRSVSLSPSNHELPMKPQEEAGSRSLSFTGFAHILSPHFVSSAHHNEAAPYCLSEAFSAPAVRESAHLLCSACSVHILLHSPLWVRVVFVSPPGVPWPDAPKHAHSKTLTPALAQRSSR